ncbi:hypothetical protein LOF13_22395 [Klebsiella pneumoniae subsp. pneumoniae]|nr:hypothetical protein LOF13_22395 [Klebsiella pneumoniae subsp. pneumoniae]
MVQNVTSNAPLWCIFARQVPLRRILPDLSPVFAIKGPLCGLFHFWHSPCFISIVLAAAITEY